MLKKLLYITNHGVPDGYLVCQPHHQTSPSKLSAVFRSPCIFCLLEPHWEKAMAPHSSTLAWKTPWMEEPGGLQSMGLLRVRHTERLHFHFSLSCIGEGNGHPLQCSCLENPRDWWAAVYGVAQSQTRLKQFSSSSSSRADRKLHPPQQSRQASWKMWC